MSATIAEPQRLRTDAGSLNARLAGAVLGDIEEVQDQRRGGSRGVEVIDVERGSPAWRAGLRAGDVIVSINRQALASVADVSDAVRRSANGLLLNIRRGNAALYIAIQ